MTDQPYDPIPDIAALLRALEWGGQIGPVSPHTVYAPWSKLAEGLGIVGAQPALEWEKKLYRQLALMAGTPAVGDPPAVWRQRFVTNMDGVNECGICHQPMVDGIIAHHLDCKAMWISDGRPM